VCANRRRSETLPRNIGQEGRSRDTNSRMLN
jgi:hypothetical protein